jgi:hypothetical protein
MQNCTENGKFCIKIQQGKLHAKTGCAMMKSAHSVWLFLMSGGMQQGSAGKSWRDKELRGLLACGELTEELFGTFVADVSVGDSGGPAGAKCGSAVGRHTRFQSGGSEHSVF